MYKQQLNNDFYNKLHDGLDNNSYDILLTNVNSILFDYSDHHLSNKWSLKKRIKETLLDKLWFFFFFKNNFLKKVMSEKVIVSNAYVNLSFDNSLALLPPWVYSLNKDSVTSWRMGVIIRKINREFKKKSIKILLSSDFKNLMSDFEFELERIFLKVNVGALIVPNDLSFYEKLSIKTANKIGIPSFVYLHGLPSRYNILDDSRADFLLVWSNGIKDEYIAKGVDREKILAIKHPYYSEFHMADLESDLSNVLVLSKAICGTPSTSTELVLPNRSVILYYLELLKENLVKLGVEKAMLRLHPSEDREFYLKNLPDDFFSISSLSKEEDLSNASLIIGPTSTMILDAIKSGKNYILFDPIVDGLTLVGTPLVEPFTGNSFIKLSNSLEEIKENIDNPKQNIDFFKLNKFFTVDEIDNDRFLNAIKKK